MNLWFTDEDINSINSTLRLTARPQCFTSVSSINVCLWTFNFLFFFFSLSLHFNQCQQRSFLSSRPKFLNISPSTAVAVRDDLKTAKKGGLTRGLYVTGFPCQIRLCACQ